ncbi:ribonuclease H-like domain-containing protein [Naematelia encephala]|uniref:Ribonuclease n=1 Tax=Naematelia encephala TaxID=71784 RepID=A0A1Y2BF74_9TREE|nr:ribonuclease H-like domain-containing protein [Naematelia encephala]
MSYISNGIDPVDLTPIPPLVDSYIFHSPLPSTGTTRPIARTQTKTEPTELETTIIDREADDEGWIMGIDEAGRGPVLGPMVYAAAYCPLSFKPILESLGFDDSKALSPEVRQNLWNAFTEHDELNYSSAVLSPQDISAGMLRRVPINLNRQAEDATISLIRSALERNVPIKECYVDALGPSPQWQARLSAIFPTISFTVCPKADSLFKIVSAASIIAKVTRDRYVHNWIDPEDVRRTTTGYKKEEGEEATTEDEEQTVRGSGYPSDPKTQAYLKDELDPVFGYKGVVRFSWATVKVLLEKQGVECKWIDDNAQPSASSWFGSDADPGKPKMWRDLGVSGVGEL